MNNASFEVESYSEIVVPEPPAPDAIFAKNEKIRFDISHIPNGSKINIADGNFINFTYNALSEDEWMYSFYDYPINLYDADSLMSIQGDTLIVEYSPPWFFVNGIDILQYANPRFSAYLEDDTLHVEYSFEKANVIIMPIWGLIRQFDIFKDRGLYLSEPIGFNSSSRSSGAIFISVE